MDLSERNDATVQRHPWELARGAFCGRLVRSTLANRAAVSCLDVGCGDAWFARQLLPSLPAGSTIVGWDPALRDVTGAVADLPTGLSLTAEPPQGTFDLILCMDVIEHLEDDAGMLRQLVEERLKPDGILLCTVPAWPSLFSDHDVALQHFRRYAPREGAAVLEAAGLRIVRRGGLFHALAVVRWLQTLRWRRVPAKAHGIGRWDASPLVTASIAAVLSLEGWLSWAAARVGLQLPGLSWWAICRRP